MMPKRLAARCKRLILTAAVASLFLLSAAPAEAQITGTVDIEIDFPSLMILYYYSSLSVDVPATAVADLMSGGVDEYDQGAGTATASYDSGTGFLDGDTALAPTALTGDPANVSMVLGRTWAVRSIGLAAGSTTVSVVPGASQTLSGTNGGTIDITDVRTRLSSDTTGSGSASVNWTPLGLGSVQRGDLVLDLDVSNALASGTYNNGGGSQVTITATNP